MLQIEEVILEMIKDDPLMRSRAIAIQIEASHSTVRKILQQEQLSLSTGIILLTYK